ncbi:hypothetical protein [Microbacterium sp. PAMC21962]|uniref:hypothetical protein n=1 Tax=Microbacterium sp. PAMC21962 TaxID=2861280 RepID=UPI001C6362F6|nr:hypothetical protein [Microbacterium sp. PAMC21962]QYF98468.1 hypothetical protein KY498_04275 [Microbacterium sp. PAMC21962]
MSTETDPLVWSVDRSWGNVKKNRDGDMYPSDYRKYHVDRGDTTAKCNSRIFLNSMKLTRPVGFGGAIYDDMPAGRASELNREDVCRRCVPLMPQPAERESS